jgi:hypothetical protein
MTTDNRNIDFATKYSSELQQMFSENSLTEAYITKADDFRMDGGVASAYFRTVDTSDFLTRHTGPVFNTPTAVASDMERKDLELFYQINKVIPNVDINDSAGAMKMAGKIMALGIKEQWAPLVDKIRIATGIMAAQSYGAANVVPLATNGNIMDGIGRMIATLKNQRSYSRTQALFIPASIEPLLDRELFSIYTPSKNDKIVRDGVLGTYKGIEVVILPDDLFNTMGRAGTAPYAEAVFTAAPRIRAILWDKRVMKDCRKLYELHVLTGKDARVAGVDGALLRGLFRPGTWVFDANKTKKAVTILQAPA